MKCCKISAQFFMIVWVMLQLPTAFSLAANDNLSVKIINIGQRTRYSACDDIFIKTEVIIQAGTINRVYFYANGTSVGSARKAPYELTWENVPTGIFEITARVRDTDGNDAFSDPVLVFVDPVIDNDIVINGEFSCKKWPWILNTYEGAAATFDIDHDGVLSDSSMAIVDIESGGTANWNIQLVQYVGLDSTHTYEISYMLEPIEPVFMLISLHLDVSPYTVYWSDEFQLNEFGEFGPHTFECNVNDPKARLTFQIGTNEGPIFIDAVQIIDLNWEDTHFTAIEENSDSASTYNLSQNYPNPFNPDTFIEYTIPNSEYVNITVYNVLGEKIKSLVNGKRLAGTHTIKWDGTDSYGESASSGIYFYKIIAGSYVKSHKMHLMR